MQISISNNYFQLTTPDSLIGFSQGSSNWLRCFSISVSGFDWLSTRFVKLKHWPHMWTTVNKKQIKQKYFNQFFNEREGIIIYNNILFHKTILFQLFLLSVSLTFSNEVTRCNLEVLFNWVLQLDLIITMNIEYTSSGENTPDKKLYHIRKLWLISVNICQHIQSIVITHKYPMNILWIKDLLSYNSLTSEKADCVSTVLMESYILVQKANDTSTPTTLGKWEFCLCFNSHE